MKAITIDNLGIKDHVRWAQDQALLDPVYLAESPLAAHHPEILWTTSIHSSKWEELFEWHNRNLPWAAFTTPDKYHLVSKRLFSYRLFPTIHWEEESDESDDSDQEEQEDEMSDLVKQLIQLKKFPNQPAALFEKDKSAMLNLLNVIKYLNSLLRQINTRKLQYQKG
jgi:hypothetical protein